SSRRRHTRFSRDWSSDVCSSDLENGEGNAYIDPLRDNTKGRIYRLVHEDAKRYKPVKLNPDRPSTLVDALESDNLFWRLTAQRRSEERRVGKEGRLRRWTCG